MHLRILLLLIFIPCSSLLAQDSLAVANKEWGIGFTVSSLSRATLVQSRYESWGGTGFELGVRLRVWRCGLTAGFGRHYMQTPDQVNLQFNRIKSAGGEFEFRWGKQQRWITLVGFHNHKYIYQSKETEIAPGIVVQSLRDEIQQYARSVGGAYQLHPSLRVGLYYQWERINNENLAERIPSSAYLLARLSFIIDSNVLHYQIKSRLKTNGGS